jgi:hypothetical protein
LTALIEKLLEAPFDSFLSLALCPSIVLVVESDKVVIIGNDINYPIEDVLPMELLVEYI